MILIQGKGVSNGVAIGPLYFYQRAKATITRYEVADADAEWTRFKDAQVKAIEQLGELAEKARAEAGDEAAMLFETHQMMCEDMDYEEAIENFIKEDGSAFGMFAHTRASPIKSWVKKAIRVILLSQKETCGMRVSNIRYQNKKLVC